MDVENLCWLGMRSQGTRIVYPAMGSLMSCSTLHGSHSWSQSLFAPNVARQPQFLGVVASWRSALIACFGFQSVSLPLKQATRRSKLPILAWIVKA